jgi:hypothetical protein
MGLPLNGDLVPTHSGFANLGVNVNENAQNAFDITSIRPFNHIHMISGVFHDSLYGQSGVLRFNQPLNCFEVSIDGGLTFDCLLTSLDGSGLNSINGALGPFITIDGANGATILTDGNTLTVDVSGLSGIIDPSGGVGGINGQIGPHLELKGNNGIDINVTQENCLVFDGGALSGLVFTVSGALVTELAPDGSGIHDINGATGPLVTLDGANGAAILTDGNTLTVDVSGLSGIIDPSGGIGGINGQIGPYLEFKGNNGIDVNITDENCLVFDGAGLSGLVFTVSGQLQTNIDTGGGGDGSGLNAINGALGPNIEITGGDGVTVSTSDNNITIDVLQSSGVALCRSTQFTEQTSVNLQHSLGTQDVIVQVHNTDGSVVIPDSTTITDSNSVDVTFNRPRSGRVVAIGCSSGVSSILAEERAGLKQGLNPYSLDGSGITIPVGKVHLVDENDNHRVLKNPTEFVIDRAGGGAANTWYYMYAHASGTTSNTITESNIDFVDIEPAFDETKLGWYDPSPGNARRCIGAVQSRLIFKWRACTVEGGIHKYSDSFRILLSLTTNYASQDITVDGPVFSNIPVMNILGRLAGGGGADAALNWYTAGNVFGGNGVRVMKLFDPGLSIGDVLTDTTEAFLPVNPDTKAGHLEVEGASTLAVEARQQGFVIPNYIGDTPG